MNQKNGIYIAIKRLKPQIGGNFIDHLQNVMEPIAMAEIFPDNRTKSISYMTSMEVAAYLDLVEKAYENKGGLEGQREPLRTTTGRRIRARLVEDLCQGAVIPPLVVGLIADKAFISSVQKMEEKDFLKKVGSDFSEDVSVIDGMQRTTALKEAMGKTPKISDSSVRVEFWISENVDALVYRMLVLNTGQVPWNLSRQLEVVYRSLVKEIRPNVPEIDRLLTTDEPGRRVKSGEYQSSDLIELYLDFSSRKTKIDTKEAISEEFAKLDFVENLSRPEFQGYFYTALSSLAKLDKAFSQFQSDAVGRFSKGKNIFDSQPARVGFIVAFGIHVLGRPGATLPSAVEASERSNEILRKVSEFCTKLEKLNIAELEDFLKLDVLRQTLEVKSGKVGEYEREVFLEAFKVLIEDHSNLDSMEPCWRAR